MAMLKRSGKRLGTVAEFCCACRRITTHGLHATKQHSLGCFDWVRCETCGLCRGAARHEYLRASRSDGSDLDALIRETAPNLAHVYAGRFELEDRLVMDQLDPHERTALIQEPLRLAAFMILIRSTTPDDDNLPENAGVAFIGLLLLGIGALFAFQTIVNPDGRIPLGWPHAIALFGPALTAFVLSIILGFGSRRRYVRKVVEPIVAAALRPLEPSTREIVSAQANLLTLDINSRHVSPARVLSLMGRTGNERRSPWHRRPTPARRLG